MATQVSGIIEQIQPSGSSGTKYAIASTAYGYCQTAANQKAKTVDMTGFELIKGVTIHVKFQYNNTAASPTLNVNGTGALNIVQYGTTATGTTDETTSWYAGAVVSFTYDGTSWVRDQGFNTNTTYTFENGTNGFKVTPLGGTAQTVTVTPSITNNITGTGTENYLTKFTGANTIGNSGLTTDSNNNLTIPGTIYFSSNTSTSTGKALFAYNSTYPKFGIWYKEGDPDVMAFSASGNADTTTSADFAVEGGGKLYNKGNIIPNTGNSTGNVGSTTQTVYIDGGVIKAGTTLGTAATHAHGDYALAGHDHNSTYLKLDGSNNMSNDLGILFGDTDKFLHFKYSTGSLINNSWRTGVLGSGSGDTNYYVIQSGGVNNSTSGVWVTALRIGQQTYDVGFEGNVYPINTTKTLGTSTNAWANVYATTFTGSGASLTSLNASNLSSGTVPSARLPAATSDAFGAVKTGSGITNTNGVISVSASNLGLSNAMHFIGIATQTITDGGTEDPTISGYSTKTAGDVVIDKDTRREYVWSTANKWEMLGFDASTTYSKTTSGNTFISSISQATDGTVTAESRTLDTSGTWSGTATNATYTSYIKSPDTRATEIVPQDLNANSTGVRFDFKQKSVTSLKANYSGVMSYRPYSHDSDWSGGPAHQLAFDENGIHWRKSTNSTTWGSWNQLVTITDQTAVGNTNAPVYVDANGIIQACTTYENASVSHATSADSASTISTAGGTTATFWRGDNSWSNTIKQTANAVLGIDSNLKIGAARKDLNFDISNGSGTGINDGYAGGITWGQGTYAYAGIYYQSSGAYGTRLILATTNLYADGAKARMIITSDGKVGIGTLSPSYALSVNGDISATNFRGALIGNADTATRIDGNLGALTDASSHNIWVSSTNAADGIPKYISGVYVTASTGVITAKGFSGPLSGNATSANYINLYEGRSTTTTLNKAANYIAAGAMFHLVASSSTSATDNGKTPTDANILQMNWDNSGGYDAQLGIATGVNRMYFRARPSSKTAWDEVAHAPVGTAGIGNSTQPVYMTSEGVITACTSYADASVNYATSAGSAASATTATSLATSKTLWGQSFNGSANVTGSMTDVGPAMKLPANQAAFQFLTSTSGAADGYFGRLGLAGNYSTIDLNNYRLDVNGNGRFRDVLTIYKEGTTSQNLPAKITFTAKDTDKNTTNTGYIAYYHDHATTYNGNLVISSGGGTFVGGGESAASIYSALGSTTSTENLYLSADGSTYIYSNADTAANRIGFTITTGGHLLPQKAETNNTKAQDLGSASAMWRNLYLGNAGEVGVEVDNTQTTNPNKVAFIVGSSGNGGIYSRKHSKWIVYADANGNVVLNGNATSASKISAVLNQTTKTYLLGTTTTITATAANVSLTGDTGIYLTTTTGELSAVRHSWNISGTEKAYTTYNSTDDSIDFIFL